MGDNGIKYGWLLYKNSGRKKKGQKIMGRLENKE